MNYYYYTYFSQFIYDTGLPVQPYNNLLFFNLSPNSDNIPPPPGFGGGSFGLSGSFLSVFFFSFFAFICAKKPPPLVSLWQR